MCADVIGEEIDLVSLVGLNIFGLGWYDVISVELGRF